MNPKLKTNRPVFLQHRYLKKLAWPPAVKSSLSLFLFVQLLQRLLDDRRPTVEMIRAEGERIAATADTQDREKIQTQLQSLAERWTDLLDKASAR